MDSDHVTLSFHQHTLTTTQGIFKQVLYSNHFKTLGCLGTVLETLDISRNRFEHGMHGRSNFKNLRNRDGTAMEPWAWFRNRFRIWNTRCGFCNRFGTSSMVLEFLEVWVPNGSKFQVSKQCLSFQVGSKTLPRVLKWVQSSVGVPTRFQQKCIGLQKGSKKVSRAPKRF